MENKFKWNDQFIEQLIYLYEERACLWDPADKSYLKRDVKERSLQEISEELNLDVAIIKNKLSCLRKRSMAENVRGAPHISDTLYIRHPIYQTPHISDTPYSRHPI